MKTVVELSMAESDAYFLFSYALANNDMPWFRLLFLLQGASLDVINLILSLAVLQNNGEVVKTCLSFKPHIQTNNNALQDSFRLACEKNDQTYHAITYERMSIIEIRSYCHTLVKTFKH